MCVCDNENVGSVVLMNGTDGEFCEGKRKMFLDLEIFRGDRWSAVLTATAVTEENRKYSTISLNAKINYCPMCGRRLSLRDAGKEGT